MERNGISVRVQITSVRASQPGYRRLHRPCIDLVLALGHAWQDKGFGCPFNAYGPLTGGAPTTSLALCRLTLAASTCPRDAPACPASASASRHQ